MTASRLRRIGVGVVLGTGIAAATGAMILSSGWAAARVKREAVLFIESRFDAQAEVAEVSWSLFPRVAVTGQGLKVTRRGEPAGTPFVEVARFEISGTPLALLRRSVSRIEVDGLVLRVTRGRGDRPPAVTRRMRDVRVGQVHARNSRLIVVPDNPAKLPLQFDLHEVTLSEFRFDGPSAYAALITNPKPRAVIQSEGFIGPWNTHALRSTPLKGVYLFKDGALDTIKGIGGTLTSTGQFSGVLERIDVQGTTSSPDFQLQLARQPVPLETRFSATVDGTSGDTYLHDVEATLGTSRIHATGAVTSKPGATGRTVSLQVTARGARFDDLLRLAVKAAQPPMRGEIDLDTGFDLPPGEADVPERLLLGGRFAIRRGSFASDTVQDRVDELSRRGRGEPGNEAVSNVISNFGGTFTLRNGLLALPSLRFSVRGARVDLAGTYRLQTEAIDLTGTLSLDAPLSRTVTGFKSVLLKAVDPVFRRGTVGTRVPIRISGSIDKPGFKIDFGRVLKRG